MAEQKTIPLSVTMENAKVKIVQTVNQVSNEMKLPAFLLEGAILDVLAEIRNQKTIELVSYINAMNTQSDKSKERQEE